MGGIMSVTGTDDGPPVKVGVPAADMAGGVFASQAILAALFARERTGVGQRVDVSLLDALLSFQVVPLSMYLASGESPKRLGSAAPYAAPNEAFPTRDGHVMVAAYTEKRWPALCKVLGRPELANDPRFDTNDKRVRGRSDLQDVLAPLFEKRSTAEWIELLDNADVLCGPILDYEHLTNEEHVRLSESITTVEHPATGGVRSPRLPARFSGTTGDFRIPAPPIPGEHSSAVMREHGFTDTEISNLITAGVVLRSDVGSDDRQSVGGSGGS